MLFRSGVRTRSINRKLRNIEKIDQARASKVLELDDGDEV